MYFRQLLHEEKSCASYLVGCPTREVCAVIDPQGEPRDYITQITERGMTLNAILETHVQADHLSCARELGDLTGAPVYIGSGTTVHYPHHALNDGQIIPIGNRRIQVIHTPGHTSEHVCFLVDDWFLLTGDTLFVGDVGRVDLSLAETTMDEVQDRARQLYHSLQRLLALPDWVELYPGHYAGSVCGRGMDGKPMSTIGRERRYNPALQWSPEEFVANLTQNLPPLPADFQAIKQHNLGKH